ncbi:unnamed protein product [Meloidogyne enterolobii]|uniref:Uncharacterized protein n=1 Tax=Meloidogyne enterolobii TaxID=390850 RepID=A0ACB0XXI0_MELEN
MVNNKRVDTRNWICNRCQMEISQKFEYIAHLNSQDPQQREDFHNKIFIRFLIKNRYKNKTLRDLAKAMRALNSREFSLGSLGVDDCYYKLPFDELFNLKNDQNLAKKSCFYCRRLEEKHVISCDFCHAKFCFDCLTPPLTACSNERFMCPLHVEKFVVGIFFIKFSLLIVNLLCVVILVFSLVFDDEFVDVNPVWLFLT